MHNQLTAVIEPAEGWYLALCPEIPGTNGQGRTTEEATTSLEEAIELILKDRRLPS